MECTHSLVPNLHRKNKNSAIKLSMKVLPWIRLLVSMDFVKNLRTIQWSQNSQKSCLRQCNKPSDYLKSSIRPSSSKMDSENWLSGKVLMDYTSPLPPPPLNTIVRALNVSNYSTRVDSNLMQAETLSTAFWNSY